MKKMRLLFWAFIMLLLTGCQTAVSKPVPTNTASPPKPTPTAEPTKEIVVVVDYCVDCHTDKDQLIAVADPVEDEESESSGVG